MGILAHTGNYLYEAITTLFKVNTNIWKQHKSSLIDDCLTRLQSICEVGNYTARKKEKFFVQLMCNDL